MGVTTILSDYGTHTGNQLALLTGHTDNIFAVAISPDGPSSQVVVLMGHNCVYGMLTQGTVLQFLKDIPQKIYAITSRRMVESSPARVAMDKTIRHMG